MNIFTAPVAQVWVPLALTPREWNERSSHYLEVIGRLKPGISPDLARAQMNSIEQELVHEYPSEYIGSDIKLVPLHAQVVGNFRSALLLLFGAVGFVLVIACANVANLLLARATLRGREVAVRSALGATTGRLIRQLVTESVTLASAGGIVGVVAAFALLRLLQLLLPGNFPRITGIHHNSSALLFTAFVSVATGILFGLAPALESSPGLLHWLGYSRLKCFSALSKA